MLKIVFDDTSSTTKKEFGRMLQSLAIAEASCMKQNSKALDHFIAIVKCLEDVYGFHFEEYKEDGKANPYPNGDIYIKLDLGK